ncbi:adenylate/guanylate cyclase domain-containing protein [Paraburkholderia terrae]|uniref:adenylate/guanylate cyclase domain-containing protein n=1 Tax=Paraburkholderia terrae TaxID=311230 RepID=UPI0033655450
MAREQASRQGAIPAFAGYEIDQGDALAYEKIPFLRAPLLEMVAQRHSGAIVKTIGDTVMAVFCRPTDAVSASLRIVEEIGRFNRDGEPAIILKIGAHCGPSIAVTLNDNLDYFGQAVKVVARVRSFRRRRRDLPLGSAL